MTGLMAANPRATLWNRPRPRLSFCLYAASMDWMEEVLDTVLLGEDEWCRTGREVILYPNNVRLSTRSTMTAVRFRGISQELRPHEAPIGWLNDTDTGHSATATT